MSHRPELRPTLKPLQVGALALGCIIGFGCFVLPGDFLATAGPLGATLGVLLGGGAMLIIARSYGVMVRAFPVAGAEFAYAYHACGRYHAYVCGWFLALGYLSIVPLNATALGVVGKFVAPQLFARGHLYTVAGFEVFAGEVLLAGAAIVAVGLFQIRGVSGVGRLQVALTALLVAGGPRRRPGHPALWSGLGSEPPALLRARPEPARRSPGDAGDCPVAVCRVRTRCRRRPRSSTSRRVGVSGSWCSRSARGRSCMPS